MTLTRFRESIKSSNRDLLLLIEILKVRVTMPTAVAGVGTIKRIVISVVSLKSSRCQAITIKALRARSKGQ